MATKKYKTLKDFINAEINKTESKLKTIDDTKHVGISYHTGELVAFNEVMKFLEGKAK